MTTSRTELRRRFDAPRSAIFRALISAEAVQRWYVPEGMTSHVHMFEPRVGGAFRISLTYDEPTGTGKTTEHTDTYHGRFVALEPDTKVVQEMAFESDDPAMQGPMRVTFILTDAEDGAGTLLHAVHEGVPAGVRPEDNELGWSMSLDKLARYLERPH